MKAEDVLNNWPDEWREDQGVKLTDTMHAVFLQDGQPLLGLFARQSVTSIAPMAVSRTGNVYLVVECKVKGYFKPAVHLTLKDKDGGTTGLKVPVASLAKEFEDSAVKFVSWVETISSSLKMTRVPSFMFARNIRLQA